MMQEISNSCFILEDDRKVAVQNILKDLPHDLNKLYAYILATLATGKSCQLSRRFLQWLSCSTAPLSLQEIGAISKITVDTPELRAIPSTKAIRLALSECCGPLIKFDDKKSRETYVSLIHSSVKDYLHQSSHNINIQELLSSPGESEMLIAQSCLTYLYYPDIGFAPFHDVRHVGESFESMELIFEHYLKEYPFLSYCATS